MQISCVVTTKQINTFIFATPIVQSFYYPDLKFPTPSHLLWLYSLVVSHFLRNHYDLFSLDATHFMFYVPVLEDLEKAMRQEFNIAEEKEVRLWDRYMTNMYVQLKKKKSTMQDVGLYSGHIVVLEQKNEDGTWPRETATPLKANPFTPVKAKSATPVKAAATCTPVKATATRVKA